MNNKSNVRIWPHADMFFNTGVQAIQSSLVVGENQTVSIINMSSYYIKSFLTNDWIHHFSGSRIILIPDRFLEPLAGYLLCHYSASYDMSCITTRQFYSRTYGNMRRINFRKNTNPMSIIKLSGIEYFILSKTIQSELSVKEMSVQYNLNLTSVYTGKNRLEKKLGTRLSTLLCRSHDECEILPTQNNKA